MAGRKKTEQKPAAKNIGLKAALYTLGLIVAAIAIIAISSAIVPRVGGFMHDRPAPVISGEQQEFPFIGMAIELEDYALLRLGLSLLNVALVMYLLYVYVSDYLTLKSGFTLGIIAVLFSFLMYALSTLQPLSRLFGGFGGPSIFSFVPMLFSAIGLLIFAKLGNE